MKLILVPCILGFALALPTQELPTSRPNCIRMTPEKEEQIDLIVEKLGKFLNNLSIEHEHFDIRLIKLSIEQHTENEVEEKETVLNLLVNDCQMSEDKLEEIDHHREMAEQHEKEREAKVAKLKQEQEVENRKPAVFHEKKCRKRKNKQETRENSDNSAFHKQTTEETKNEQETPTRNEHSDVHEQKGANILKEGQESQEKSEDISKREHKKQNTDVKPQAEKLTNDEEEAKPEDILKAEHKTQNTDVKPEGAPDRKEVEKRKNDKEEAETDNILNIEHKKQNTDVKREAADIKEAEKQNNAEEETEDISKTEHENHNTDEKTDSADREEAENLKNDDEEAKTGKNFEFMYLDLDENTDVKREAADIKEAEKQNNDEEETEDISKTEHENHNTDEKTDAADREEAENLKNDDEEAKTGKKFEFMYLDLDENAQKLVNALGREKKPLIVYVQERNPGQKEYWFLKRR